MRRVLIVSPNFPPVNTPDHQRVRMSLPYFREFGWEPVILAVRPEFAEGTHFDQRLWDTLPDDVEIYRTGALPARLTRVLGGLGNMGLRALPYLFRAGNKILRERRCDVVYFSTTLFPVMMLGPVWRKRFDLPYILDFQDPWLDDYYDQPGAPSPPGGRFKHAVNQRFASWGEPWVMRAVSQVIAVSPTYLETFRRRYPWLRPEQLTTLSFGAPEKDFEQLPALGIQQKVFNAQDGKQHWVYVGRAGDDMAAALGILFASLHAARDRDPGRWNGLRLHFVGTSYAPAGLARKTVEPIAQIHGVCDLVEEHTGRVPYFEGLQILLDSQAIIVIGSDSAAYSASKLYPCMLARRPLLALLHEDSPAVGVLRRCRAGEIVTFRPSKKAAAAAAMSSALAHVLAGPTAGPTPATDSAYFLAEYGARAVTARQCAVFDRALFEAGTKT